MLYSGNGKGEVRRGGRPEMMTRQLHGPQTRSCFLSPNDFSFVPEDRKNHSFSQTEDVGQRMLYAKRISEGGPDRRTRPISYILVCREKCVSLLKNRCSSREWLSFFLVSLSVPHFVRRARCWPVGSVTLLGSSAWDKAPFSRLVWFIKNGGTAFDTNPLAHNPKGGCRSIDRREEIYTLTTVRASFRFVTWSNWKVRRLLLPFTTLYIVMLKLINNG